MSKIKNHIESAQEIKKSRFLTYLQRVESEQEAKDFLKLVRKNHPDASHHCYAYRTGNIERSSDDGEPAGTAGHPMLDVLKKRDVEDVLAVVVRYFGGTLLGTGGLVRAYSSSVSQALDQAILVRDEPMMSYRLEIGPEWIGKVEAFFRQNHIEIIQSNYGVGAEYLFVCDRDPNDTLAALSQGKLQARPAGEILKEVEVS